MLNRKRPRPWFRRDRRMWHVTFKGEQIPLGVSDPKDQRGAEEAARKLLGESLPHHSPRSEPTAPNAGPTVAEGVAAYLADVDRRRGRREVKAASIANYRLALSHFSSEFGPRPLTSLAVEEVETWADRPEWSSSYQHNLLGTVQQLLRHYGIALGIKRPPKESRGADSALTDEQFAQVLAAAKKYKGVASDLPELLRVLRECGARPQEVATLRVEQVDWAHAVARLREHKTARHGGERIIHFNKAAMTVLQKQRKRYKSGLLFRTRHGNPYSPTMLVTRLLRISERVGFRVIAYGLRHAFVTRALERGVPDAVVAALVGHANTAMIANYSHVGSNARALKAAAEQASASATTST